MYKVFFKDRIVFFLNDFPETFRSHTGLFYRYGNHGELNALIRAWFDLEKIPRLYLTHEDPDYLKKEFTSCFRLIKAAGGVVTNHDGHVMIIKRHGLWDLPKGKTEEGESMEETALREVREECSIDNLKLGELITITWHAYILDGQPALKETYWYAMKSGDGSSPYPQLKEDITETIWFGRDELDKIRDNTYPSIIEVLTVAGML